MTLVMPTVKKRINPSKDNDLWTTYGNINVRTEIIDPFTKTSLMYFQKEKFIYFLSKKSRIGIATSHGIILQINTITGETPNLNNT